MRLPILYNTSGCERVETLRLLEDIVDIYLSDSKYTADEVAERISGFKDYVRHNRAALLEMQRQVGSELLIKERGIATRGMIIRHLVLPGGLSQTTEVLRWIAEKFSKRVHISHRP